ncbi:MAG: potassium channel family protein, partial [Shewanella sp.]
SKLGVSRIIHPEEEMGIRVAQALNYPMVNNYLPLGNGLYVVEVHIRNKLHNTPIAEILKGSVKPILVKRGTQVFSCLNTDFRLYEGDVFLLCGTRAELKSIAPRLM